jgi:hypothetical protein
VALGSNISSETARVGDVWHGTVTENVMARNESVIPPGSDVDGVVTGVTPARHGSPAILELGVRSIRTNGRDEPIAATSEPVVAGSARARNLGAISGRLASAAPIVLAAGGDGIAAGHVVARPGSHPVVLTDGIVMAFTVSRTAAVRSPGE